MSDQYLLPCACGRKLRVSRAQAGQEVPCDCGKNVTVPTLRGLRDLEPAPPDAGSPARGRRFWSPLQGALFSGGLVVATVALFIGLSQFWAYRFASHFTEDQSGVVIDFEEAQIDSAPPEELLNLWHEMAEHGLGEKITPPWVDAQRSAAIHSWRAYVAFGIAACGLVLAVASLFLGGRQ